MKIASVKPTTLSYQLENLVEGNEYMIHVIAENDEGQSAPVETAEAIRPEREPSKWHNS